MKLIIQWLNPCNLQHNFNIIYNQISNGRNVTNQYYSVKWWCLGYEWK